MKLINCTPHAITIHVAGQDSLHMPASGVLPRLATTREVVDCIAGIPTVRTTTGQTTGLPDQVDGVTLVVSAMVAQANTARRDLACPGELVRGPDGQPTGCKGLCIFWE